MAWWYAWKKTLIKGGGKPPFFIFIFNYKTKIMNLYETIDILKKIALKQPNVRTAVEGNIYEIMNANPSIEYDGFIITQGTHSQNELFNNFQFNLFYVSRLVDNMEDNRLQIQSIGIEVLSNIVRIFSDIVDSEYNNLTFTTFTQKFADECAGVYLTITFDVLKDLYCPEEY